MWGKQLLQQDLHSGASCELLQVLTGDLPRDSHQLHQGQEVCYILECKQKYQHIVSADDFTSTLLSVKDGGGGLCGGRLLSGLACVRRRGPFIPGTEDRSKAGIKPEQAGFCFWTQGKASVCLKAVVSGWADIQQRAQAGRKLQWEWEAMSSLTGLLRSSLPNSVFPTVGCEDCFMFIDFRPSSKVLS